MPIACIYVSQRYSGATIVFYGYQNGPTIKYTSHHRRTSNLVALKLNFLQAQFSMACKKSFCVRKNKRNIWKMC